MNIGLKLWSRNTEYYLPEAVRLYKAGWFSYIELCVVPGTTHTIDQWRRLNDDFGIPFALHAPHSALGVNLADRAKEESNIEAYKEVKLFARVLDAKFTVVHSGINGSIKETIRQLNIIKPENILIENKPYKTIYGEPICCGAVPEELKEVLAGYKAGFCLDVGHAICTANALSLEPYAFLAELNSLGPTCYHLSDNFIDGDIDKHLHFGRGNYDIAKIFGIINMGRDIAIETVKDSKENLDDFIEDVKWLRELH